MIEHPTLVPDPAAPRSRALCFRAALAGRLVLMCLATLAGGCAGPDTQEIEVIDLAWIDYPEAARGDTVDTYHGVEVADPYRWMEDEASAESQAWLAEQDAIMERFFAQLPEHGRALSYLEDNWLDGVVSVPVRQGDRTFFWETVEGASHDVLHVQKGDGEPEVVFDLNERDPEGIRSTRTSITVSPKGRYVSYPIHQSGADAAEIRIYDTEAGRELEEIIPTAYVFISDWLPDESGFFYTWVDLPTLMGQSTAKEPGIYRHLIGTPVESDELVYGRAWGGQYMAAAVVADDEKHLLVQDLNIMGSRGGWGVRLVEGDSRATITWLIEPGIEYRFAYVGSSGTEVFLCTDYESPSWRIVAVDIRRPGLDKLREVVPELEEPISMFGGSNAGHVVLHDERLYVTYIQHNSNVIRIYDLEGEPQGEIDLPFPGSVAAIGTKKDDPVLHIGLQSFLVPQSVYAYDSASAELSPLDTPEIPVEFQSYEVNRVFYPAHDGRRIPMTIIQRAGTPRDGRARVMLYGYGGWGIPLLPSFSNRTHAWLHMGGVYAVANLRGGGEYGDDWHQAGQFFNKQDVFNDFFSAAEYLVRENYTTPGRLTIVGGSNGGLLTAACYNQRPELFGAVVSEVAAVDMLRIQDTPIGATVTMELGHPGQSKEMFDYLYSYSPLHNVRREGPFPPILSMVGENDPRCKPGHIYKYVAELQRTDAADRLALLRLVRSAGHGSHRKNDMKKWYADEVAFAWAMTE